MAGLLARAFTTALKGGALARISVGSTDCSALSGALQEARHARELAALRPGPVRVVAGGESRPTSYCSQSYPTRCAARSL